MAWPARIALVVGFAFSPATALGQAAIPESILNQLKAATVFVKVDTRAGQQTGSGFLFEKWETGGLIATNAHVIRDEAGKLGSVTCILHSGTGEE